MEFPRQEYWTGLSFPALGDLSDPEIESMFPVSLALAGGFFITVPPGKLIDWVAISFSRDLPDPGMKSGHPALQADSLWSEPPGKP